MNDQDAIASMPAGILEGDRRASSLPDLLLSRLDQPGIAACRSRLGTILRLMEAMRFDPFGAVQRTVIPAYEITQRIGRAVLIGDAALTPVTIGGMKATMSISVVQEKAWLAMRIHAACPPMLSPTIILETVRSDCSNLFSPADGKAIAVSALSRLLAMVSTADARMRLCMEQGLDPDPTDPARIAVRDHETRMSSLLTRACDEHEEGTTVSTVEFDFGNPHPLVRGPSDEPEDAIPVSAEALEWLASVAPPVTDLSETREGKSIVYSFRGHRGEAAMRPGADTMEMLRIHASTREAPDRVLNEEWVEEPS